jgi:hypothetical protein
MFVNMQLAKKEIVGGGGGGGKFCVHILFLK